MNRVNYLLALIVTLFSLAACAPQSSVLRPDDQSAKPWEVSIRAASQLARQGEYDLALKRAELALQQVKADSVDSRADQATVLARIGWINRLMYRHKHSESYYLQSLRLREALFGQDHSAYAESLLGLGVAYRNQQRREEAIRILRWALALADKHLGANQPVVTEYVLALADAHEDNHDYQSSLPLRQRAVALTRRQHGAPDRQLVDAQWRLAVAARQTGDNRLAVQLFDQSLDALRAVSGDSTVLASRLQVAANASRTLARFGRAEAMLKDALRIRQRTMRFDHPEIVANFEALADLYGEMGRIDDSLEYRSYASRARNGLKPY